MVSVSIGGKHVKFLTVGDHFGENSILNGGTEKRTASITAVTPVEVIYFTRHDFLFITRNTQVFSRLTQLSNMQNSNSYQVCVCVCIYLYVYIHVCVFIYVSKQYLVPFTHTLSLSHTHTHTHRCS
jgi:hypothetical protein